MSDLIPFNFAGAKMRSIVLNDEPWFVAADVCALLDIANPSQALSYLDDDERSETLITSEGTSGNPRRAIVNEPGLYSLILRSRKPEAKAIKRWVTHEVLPSIRKTGSYAANSMPDITTAAGVAQMAAMFADTANRLVASEAQVAELAPRAVVADRLLNADGDMAVADAAKALTRAGVKVGETRLFNALAEKKWIFRGADNRWRVYQTVIESGHMSVIPSSHYHPRTGVLVLDPPQVRVTPKGLQRLLIDHGVDVDMALEFSAPIGAGQ